MIVIYLVTLSTSDALLLVKALLSSEATDRASGARSIYLRDFHGYTEFDSFSASAIDRKGMYSGLVLNTRRRARDQCSGPLLRRR